MQKGNDYLKSSVKIISQIFGYDYEDEQDKCKSRRVCQHKGLGIMIVRNPNHSNPQFHDNYNYTYKLDWQKIQKYPPTSCKNQICQKLKNGINTHPGVWAWILQNKQKITTQLYNKRKSQFKNKVEVNDSNNNIYRLLTESKQAINHPVLMSIIGAVLVHREDLCYGVTIFNMAASFYYLSQANQMKTFQFLCHACVSEPLLGFLTKDPKLKSNIIIQVIHSIKSNCSSFVFISNCKTIKMDKVIDQWITNFFFSIAENGSLTKQKLLGYWICENYSKAAIIRICEATIISLSRILNQGKQQKCMEALSNPKLYMDEKLFSETLFKDF